MGLPIPFIRMTQLLFNNARASISMNGSITDQFNIDRGIRQGCPLAPYLFLFVAEALHSATRAAATLGQLTGINLPDGITQQLLLQYADDTSFTLARRQPNLQYRTALLDRFGQATGLVYNPLKSDIY
jgi:hypothetical protein